MKVGMTHNVHHAVLYDCQQHEMNKISDKIHPTQPPKPLLQPLPLLLLRLQIAKQNNYQNKSLQNHAQQNLNFHSKRNCMPPKSRNVQAMQIFVIALERIVDVFSGNFPKSLSFLVILEPRHSAKIEIRTRI